MDRDNMYSHIKRKNPVNPKMTDFEIYGLYNGLSVHFNVPNPEWKILPKIYESMLGAFLKEPKPMIVFFLRPTLETATHEFMHYLVYCVKTGAMKTERSELDENQIEKLRKFLAERKEKNPGMWNYIKRVCKRKRIHKA